MHWLVFDTVYSIKEQDVHMNYFIDASTVYKNAICQNISLIGKIPDNKHFGDYIQSKLFITSLVITDSLFNIKLLGTDLFPFKFPLYNRIFT